MSFRNPGRSRRSRRRSGGRVSIGRLFDSQTLTLFGGVLLGSVGTNYVTTKLATSLPGMNSLTGQMLWKGLIAGAAGYFLYKKNAALARGIVIGGATAIVSDFMTQQSIGLMGATSAGLQAYLGRRGAGARRPGAGAFIPGVNPLFTGPSSAFLRPGVGSNGTFRSAIPLPMPRRGVNATVGNNFVERAVGYGTNPFRS